ncbi:unnamed protein product [Cochlearia groenlandica]
MLNSGISVAYLINTFMFISLVLHLHFETTIAARSSVKMFGPPIIPLEWSLPSPPKVEEVLLYKINIYKNIEQTAFRPTGPGPSQGIGHRDPPGAP